MTQAQETGEQHGRAAKAIVILLLICLGSGAGVSVLYWGMKGQIEGKAQEVFRETLASVLGEAPDYPVVGDYPPGTPAAERVYMNKGGTGVLYAATGAARGYGGNVEVLVSVEAAAPNTPVGPDPVMHAMVVFESQETPGLGENIRAVERDTSIWGKIAGAGKRSQAAPRRPWFQEQFSGKRLSDLVLEGRRDSDKAAAVTGATPTNGAAREAMHRDADNAAAETGATPTSGAATEAMNRDAHNTAAVTGATVAGKASPEAVRRDADKIAAVTGATVTSRAAIEAARRAVERIITKTAEVYGK
jgi:Na+-translocating ferredoxin:NAD+ oxidoreductase RnfG subunit